MSAPENNHNNMETSSDQPGSSSEKELEDLEILNFPQDVDWSTTLVLRCDPSKAPYKLSDVYSALFKVVRRNDVFNLGSTTLNYAFTMSFKSNRSTEHFVEYLKNRRNGDLTVKNLPVLVSRVPSKCVTVCVRWIPMEVDTAHVVNVLKKFGTVVKTESVQSNMRGWFHVYTNERKFTILLHKGIYPDHVPYGIYVKGLLGAVFVSERDPTCLECYNSGHDGDSCKFEGCPLYKAS